MYFQKVLIKEKTSENLSTGLFRSLSFSPEPLQPLLLQRKCQNKVTQCSWLIDAADKSGFNPLRIQRGDGVLNQIDHQFIHPQGIVIWTISQRAHRRCLIHERTTQSSMHGHHEM